MGSEMCIRDRLAPTAREESFQQRFYLYLMMTKPSKQLILSWCRTGADGKSRRPSFLIGELRAMFPNAALTDQETQADPEIYSVAEAKQRLSAKLGQYRDGQLEQDEENAQFLELYRWFASSKDNQETLRRFMDAAFFVYEQQGISHAVAKTLYGEILSGIVTGWSSMLPVLTAIFSDMAWSCWNGNDLSWLLPILERCFMNPLTFVFAG